MTPADQATIPPGWIGGFAESNPAFAYPNPDLSSLPMLDNMVNIDKLQRQQAVRWPEFSWVTEPGRPETRCFQMFAPDISRLGYTDEGRVYSIICPQQGVCSASLGCLNVEVTVTGQRGWADETARTLAADMTVEGKVWFTPSAHQNPLVQFLWKHFRDSNRPFPSTKAHAIRVTTHRRGAPAQPIFPVCKGETTLFESPDFARHADEAWTVGNIEVEIGPVVATGDPVVDDFNALVMEIFNLGGGNILANGNLLSWNVWFASPELVDREEWRTHAERWRHSIDTDHGSPDGQGSSARYFDGQPFRPVEALLDEELRRIIDYLRTHL